MAGGRPLPPRRAGGPTCRSRRAPSPARTPPSPTGACARCSTRSTSASCAKRSRATPASAASASAAPSEPQEFRIDPIPRLIDAAQWDELSAGVAQRVRALELFVRDVYGERRIVRDGVVPERALAGANHYEPLLAGMGERVRSWITVAGLDVVRDSDGTFKVLEDNLRTPSGHRLRGRHARGARRASAAPGRPARAPARRRLRDARRGAASPPRPRRAGEEPFVVLLSDGERNSAFFEHATHRPRARPAARARRRPVRARGAAVRAAGRAASAPSTSSTGAPTRTACATSAAS